MHGKFGSFSLAFILLVSIVGSEEAFAGSPPLITDDPETPGYKGWEINITSSLEHTRDGSEMENPLFDINYGLSSDRDQLKVEFALLDNDPDGADREWGISDLLVGYKYRFIDFKDTCTGWGVSFYPQVSSPTGDERRDLGSGQTEFLIPFEFQKNYEESKSWVNAEIGYNVVLGSTGENSWKFGLATGKEVTEKLELEGEVGAFVFDGHTGEPDVPFFNLGFQYKCNKNMELLGSAGRSFRSREDGVPDFFCLLGVQFLLGKAAEEDDAKDEEDGDGKNEDIKSPGDEAHMPAYMRSMSTASRHPGYLINPAAQ